MHGQLVQKTCTVCGVRFQCSNPRQRYCSKMCKYRAYYRRQRGEPAETGQWKSRRPEAKTHCKRGHPFDEVNTYHPPNKPAHNRNCRACRYESHRDWLNRTSLSPAGWEFLSQLKEEAARSLRLDRSRWPWTNSGSRTEA